MKHKAEIGVRTGEFAYVHYQVEGTTEEIADLNREFTLSLKPNEGLPPAEWNKALDKFIAEGTGDIEEWQRMSQNQQWMFNEIKKSNKRK